MFPALLGHFTPAFTDDSDATFQERDSCDTIRAETAPKGGASLEQIGCGLADSRASDRTLRLPKCARTDGKPTHDSITAHDSDNPNHPCDTGPAGIDLDRHTDLVPGDTGR